MNGSFDFQIETPIVKIREKIFKSQQQVQNRGKPDSTLLSFPQFSSINRTFDLSSQGLSVFKAENSISYDDDKINDYNVLFPKIQAEQKSILDSNQQSNHYEEKMKLKYKHFKRTQVPFLNREFGTNRDFNEANRRESVIDKMYPKILESVKNSAESNVQTIKKAFRNLINNESISKYDNQASKSPVKIQCINPHDSIYDTSDYFKNLAFNTPFKVDTTNAEKYLIQKEMTRHIAKSINPKKNGFATPLRLRNLKKIKHSPKIIDKDILDRENDISFHLYKDRIFNSPRRNISFNGEGLTKSYNNTPKKSTLPQQLYLMRHKYKVEREKKSLEIEGRAPPLNSVEGRGSGDLTQLSSIINNPERSVNKRSPRNNYYIKQNPLEIRSNMDLGDFEVEGWGD